MNRETFDGEQAPARKAFSEFRKAQEQEHVQSSIDGNRAKDAFVDLCNQAVKFPRPPRTTVVTTAALATPRRATGTPVARIEEIVEDGDNEGEGDGEEDEEEDDDEFNMHLAHLRGQHAPGRTLTFPRVRKSGAEMRRFVKLFTDKQAVVINKGTEMDKCRWTGTSTGLDLNLRQWGTVKRLLSQSMQRDDGRAERDSLRIVLQDGEAGFNGWDASELTPRMVLNDAFVFQPVTIHAVGPINEWRFLPGKEEHGAFLLARKHHGGAGPSTSSSWLGIGMGYVAPVNSVNSEFVPFRAAVGLNVFELHPHGADGGGRFRTTLKLQAVFTPAQLGSVQVDWGHITQYTPVPSRAIAFRMPLDHEGQQFVQGSVFSRDGEPFSWSKEGGGTLYDEGHTIQSKMHAMLSRMPMVELAAKILMFKLPADIRAGLFRVYTRTGRAGGGRGGDEWPVFASMPSVGPFLQQQVKLMYHAHLLKLSVYVLTMDCMHLSGVFGGEHYYSRHDHEGGEEARRELLARAMQVLLINDRKIINGGGAGQDASEAAEQGHGGAELRRSWGRMLQSVMHMWHTALGTFPFGNSNQKFCTSEDYYKTVFGLETVLDALVKLHYILSHEHPSPHRGDDAARHHSHYQYARPKATITQISDALRDEVDRRVCGDREKLKFLRSSVIGDMKVGKPRFNEGSKRIRKDPLASLGLHDLVSTDATGDLRSARLRLPVTLKSITVRFDLGRTMGRFLPYWRGIQALYLPSDQCFNIGKEDLRAFPPSASTAAMARRGASAAAVSKEDWGWSTRDCCATGQCEDPVHVLNHALYRHAHSGLHELMAKHHEAQSPERMIEEHGKHMFLTRRTEGREDEDEGEGMGRMCSEERASFLTDAVSMREFNRTFLGRGDEKGDRSKKGPAAVHEEKGEHYGRRLEEEKGCIIELPLSVSGKVLTCVVNASFAPSRGPLLPMQPTSAFGAAYPPLSLQESIMGGGCSNNSNATMNNMMRILKTMAASQGVLPPRAAR